VSGSNVSAEVTGERAAGPPSDTAISGRRLWRGTITPVTVVIVAATLLALGLRMYQFVRPGLLLGVTEYDDGPYFGSAVRLVDGSLPYRDFLIVQPPGITLLMLPLALLSKVTGTAAAMATGRVLTALAGAAAVALAGLLVRHRGIFATVVVCGISAVYPDSIGAAHAVLVEPWLVLFCLIGALAVFDGDRLTTSGRRLAWGGAAFGFAGAVEVWAIVPVIVIVALSLRFPRRLAVYLAGVAAAFLIPVLPFAVLAPKGLYQGVVSAQVGTRVHPLRVPIWQRLKDLTGLANTHGTSHLTLLVAAVLITVFVLASLLLAFLYDRRPPPALDVFAVVTAALVVVMFMWPDQFHYHFGAFLGPFLAMALGLPAARLLAAFRRPGRGPAASGQDRGQAVTPVLTWCAAGLAALAVITMASLQANWETTEGPKEPVSLIPAAERLIPPGACVLTDEVSLTIMANRFISNVPGCSLLLDPTGTDFALSHGRLPGTGAARYPALAALWRNAFSHAQYVWLSFKWQHRIPWPAGLMAYFRAHFTSILSVSWSRHHPAGQMSGIYRRTSG
jgi:alpha-1,2-mannosyltransferase